MTDAVDGIQLIERRSCCQRGVSLVETALVLPLILVIILMLLWFAVTFNAKSSLDSALLTASRLAVTRGDPVRSGQADTDLIRPYKNFAASPAGLASSREILWHGVPNGRAFNYYRNNCPIRPLARPPATTFRNSAPAYYYILAYVYAAMRQSVGSSLAFPCTDRTKGLRTGPGHPAACRIAPPQATRSCVECMFLNADSIINTSVLPTDRWPPNTPLPNDRFVVRCTYTSSNIMLRPIAALFNLVGAQSTFDTFTITRDWEFNVSLVEP